METRNEGGITGKGGTGESTSENRDGSAFWERWSGSQHKCCEEPNSKSSRLYDQEGSESRSSLLQDSLGCPGGVGWWRGGDMGGCQSHVVLSCKG